MKPNVYAQKVSEDLYEYGVMKNNYRLLHSYGNLWLDGFQFAHYIPQTPTYECRGMTTTMAEAQQKMNELEN